MPQWSAYQQAIFAAVQSGSGHLVVQARAGTGKTTTIVEALRYVPRGARTLLVAFGKDIAAELRRRAPGHVEVYTTHALGLRSITRRRGRPEVDRRKGRKIALEILRAQAGALVRQSGRSAWDPRTYAGEVAELAGHGKNQHVRNLDELARLAVRFDLADQLFGAKAMAAVAADCMIAATRDVKTVDYDDMLYLPAKLGLTPELYDFVFVDEVQDYANAQLWLTRAACAPGGRIVAVGDPKQGIFHFRGADDQAIPRTIRELDAQVLPLSITYRCGRRIVDFVKSKVKGIEDFQAAPTAPEGEVRKMAWEDVMGPFGAQPGDFILSRLNAPLMPIALHFMQHGVPCRVAGRDIGKGLVKTLDRAVGAQPLRGAALQDALRAYRRVEVGKLFAVDEEEAAIALDDQLTALVGLVEDATTTADLRARIDALFSDETPAGAIVCATVHKAKGLERSRVFVLTTTFRRGNDGDEESNLFYVACTRARDQLTLVGAPPPNPGDLPVI